MIKLIKIRKNWKISSRYSLDRPAGMSENDLSFGCYFDNEAIRVGKYQTELNTRNSM